jgi:hypothetical protein
MFVSMSAARAASHCSDSGSRLGLGAFRRQMKLSFDARDRFQCQELAVGVKNEKLARAKSGLRGLDRQGAHRARAPEFFLPSGGKL